MVRRSRSDNPLTFVNSGCCSIVNWKRYASEGDEMVRLSRVKEEPGTRLCAGLGRAGLTVERIMRKLTASLNGLVASLMDSDSRCVELADERDPFSGAGKSNDFRFGNIGVKVEGSDTGDVGKLSLGAEFLNVIKSGK